LTWGEAAAAFTKLEVLAVMIASLCHDIDHPGLSNAYHKSALTSLALLYNDSSILENHHSTCTWKILFNKDTNILSSLSLEDLKLLREMLLSLILATDLATHEATTVQFETYFEQCHQKGEDPLRTSQGRRLAMQMLLKSADISNEARPWKVSKRWADLLMEEFFNQGDLERSQGMKVTPFMDREKVVQNKAQIGFIDSLLLPTLTSLSKAFPKVVGCIETAQENRKLWESVCCE